MKQPTTSPSKRHAAVEEPVVLRCDGRVVKGYLESPPWTSAQESERSQAKFAGDLFSIRALESDAVEEIPASEVKAVFFVSDLEGKPEHLNLRFHALEPVLPGVWVQVQFRDGEVIEGIVENSIRFLVEPGFFLRPTDPISNNKLIYVMKHCLAEYHVLGLTKH